MSLRAAGARFALFAVAATALTVFIAAQILGLSTTDRMPLHAVLADASGIRQGDPVRLAGVPVGQVSAVGVEAGQARLTVSVDRTLELPTDTLLAVSWVDLTGRRQVDLHPGGSRDVLGPGDELTRTRPAADLGQLTAELGPLVQVLDPDRLNELLASVDQVLTASTDDLVALTGDLAALLEAVGSRDQVIDEMITDYGTVATTLAEREQQVRRVVDDLVAVTEAFGGTEDVLGPTIDDASAILAALDDFLADNTDDLGRLVDDLAVLVATASSRADELGTGLEELPDALEALFGVLRHGNYLRIDTVCASPTEPPDPCLLSRDPVPAASRMSEGGDALSGLLLGGGAP